MKYPFSLLLLLVGLLSQAQVFVVNDADGYVNVRDRPDIKSKVLGRLDNGRLVYKEDFTNNWALVEFEKDDKEVQGYIYFDRLDSIEAFPLIPVKEVSTGSITFANDSIRITFTTKKFEKSKYKLSYSKVNPGMIELINGKPYWGTDGGLPKFTYDSVKVRIKEHLHTWPREALEGLYEPNLSNTAVYYDASKQRLYVQATNSDGAGGYIVTWVVEKGVYKDRFVCYGF